jgi:hypothetical protein
MLTPYSGTAPGGGKGWLPGLRLLSNMHPGERDFPRFVAGLHHARHAPVKHSVFHNLHDCNLLRFVEEDLLSAFVRGFQQYLQGHSWVCPSHHEDEMRHGIACGLYDTECPSSSIPKK